MTDFIDSAIAEGIAATTENAQPTADATTETTDTKATEETQAPEGKTEQDAGKPEDDTPFPKKAVNAISRRDKQIGKLRAEREQLASELEKYRQQAQLKQTQNNTPAGAPKEADYKTYAEYLEAVNDYKIDQKFAKLQGEQKQTQQNTQEQAWVSERQTAIETQAADFIKENPEALALVQEYADVVDNFSPELERLFLEADNAPLAFYNLAKEGKLEALPSMSLAKAAMEIGRAQTQTPIKPKTKAPAPLPASRGSVAAGKQLIDMSPEELGKWVTS